jgi:hypothetical protein
LIDLAGFANNEIELCHSGKPDEAGGVPFRDRLVVPAANAD